MKNQTIYFTIQGRATQYKRVVLFVLKLIERQFSITFKSRDDRAHIQFVSTEGAGYFLNPDIYEYLVKGNMCPHSFIQQGKIVSNKNNNTPDFIASLFAIINLMHEYNPPVSMLDQYGRIPYKASWQEQYHLGSGDIISPLLKEFLQTNCGIDQPIPRHRKQVHLSHDIDLLHSGFRQESKYFIRKPSSDLASALSSHLRGQKKIWVNLTEIMDLEEKFDAKSTFYFLPKQGIHRGIQHADHSLDDIRRAATQVMSRGWESGLHKSSSESDYAEESGLFPTSHPLSNRNHFLTYSLPHDWLAMDRSGIEVDTGMGWAEQPGPRNGYPLPFIPYHPEKELGLIVVPLVLMDTTFTRYLKSDKIIETWLSMVDEWKDGYCVSILFHNNSLTPWSNKHLLEAYKKLLQLFQNEKIEVVSTKNIAAQFLTP